MIDIKLRRIQIVTVIIVVVVGFFFIGCGGRDYRVTMIGDNNTVKVEALVDKDTAFNTKASLK